MKIKFYTVVESCYRIPRRSPRESLSNPPPNRAITAGPSNFKASRGGCPLSSPQRRYPPHHPPPTHSCLLSAREMVCLCDSLSSWAADGLRKGPRSTWGGNVIRLLGRSYHPPPLGGRRRGCLLAPCHFGNEEDRLLTARNKEDFSCREYMGAGDRRRGGDDVRLQGVPSLIFFRLGPFTVS